MSRGGSYGGGQSSLGYLFGSDEKSAPPPPPRPIEPPYGIDTSGSENIKSPLPFPLPLPLPNHGTNSTTKVDLSEKDKNSNNYHRAQGPNLGNFVTDRPSTKVKSVPGGDSSLGYLFGDK